MFLILSILVYDLKPRSTRTCNMFVSQLHTYLVSRQGSIPAQCLVVMVWQQGHLLGTAKFSKVGI